METAMLLDDDAGVAWAAELLLSGQIVALPTETVYGLAGDALDPAAVQAIYAAKGRPSDNPLIVHVTGVDQAAELASSVPAAARDLMAAFWPGPLTIVLPKKPVVPAITSGGLASVGLRSPAHPSFQAVLRRCGLALAAPSANLAGRPSPTTAAHAWADLNGKVPAVLDGGPSAVGLESTVISLVGEAPVLLRPGGVTLAQLASVLGRSIAVDQAVTGQMAASRAPGAPGMKYQHYAPRTPMTLLTGSFGAQRDWVLAQLDGLPQQTSTGDLGPNGGGSVGVLCFDDAAPYFAGLPTITYGPSDDAAAQARQLFSALHAVDGLGVSQVYAQLPPQTEGIFLAVRNRLLKAAAHQIINLKP